MPSTCFETEGSSSGRTLCIQLWCGIVGFVSDGRCVGTVSYSNCVTIKHKSKGNLITQQNVYWIVCCKTNTGIFIKLTWYNAELRISRGSHDNVIEGMKLIGNRKEQIIR
jgi:hypothetical protein